MPDPVDQAIRYALMDRNQLADKVRVLGFKGAMAMRRDMQTVLASAAQKGPLSGRIATHTQEDLIERITWIEKWCRLYFLAHRMKAIIVAEPDSTWKYRKRLARDEWESDILPRYSY